MIGKTIETAINDQIHAELYTFYLYLAMSAHFDESGFPGFAKWMRAQSQEEMSHALKFFAYVHERGGAVTLTAIEQPMHFLSFHGPVRMRPTLLAPTVAVSVAVPTPAAFARPLLGAVLPIVSTPPSLVIQVAMAVRSWLLPSS